MAQAATRLEKEWLDLAQEGKGNMEEMKKMLEENPNLNIDSLDGTGMTALQHAAFRGNLELCRYLLDHDADVNSDKHDNQYTTLMFGALSGNEEVVSMLLDAGADPAIVNSVKRTAGEMAAFVAQYHIGGTIENFLPSKELLKFTKATGLETRPKLKKELLKPFHAFITRYNIHPTYLLQELNKHPELLEDGKYLRQILDKLVTEKMGPHNTHESLALKLHYIACIIEQAEEAKAKHGKLDTLLKKLASGRPSDNYLERVENLVRKTLLSYPKKESKLYLILMQKLSGVEIGNEPTAIVALTDAINGNRMRTAEDRVCNVCAGRNPKRCQGCLQAFYCSTACQKLHRTSHKKFCIKPTPIDEAAAVSKS